MTVTRLWLLALIVGCKAEPDPVERTEDPVPAEVARRTDGWLRGDLHFHTNYSGDAFDQGGDWMEGALAIADAWRDPAWLDRHPEAPDGWLDYVAITDHRTTEGLTDPALANAPLIAIGGEEFGSNGHAGIWGHAQHIGHEPTTSQSANDRIAQAIDEAHAAGGLFSINHPLYSGDLWGWDVDTFDAIEVWNGTWATLAEPSSEADLDAWVANEGVENAAIRAALRAEGGGKNAQAVRFWQAWLSLGIHVPPVGGGDRHMIVPAGLPTTFVQADSTDAAGVLGGIAAGRTFVSRGPAGPQVVLTAEVDGQRYPMGAALPGATEVTVSWEVARADGGQLRLVAGVVDPALPDPEVAARIELSGEQASGSFVWTPPAGGGWLHAVVVEPLPDDVPPEHQPVYDALTTFPADGGVAAMLMAVGPLLDLELLGEPERCDPAAWPDDGWSGQCMPVDGEPFGTVYIGEMLQRLMSTEFEGGQPTGWTVGAISAAFHTAPR